MSKPIQRVFISLLGYGLMLLNLWYFDTMAIGIVASLLYVAGLSSSIGKKFFSYDSQFENSLWGFLMLLCGISTLGTVFYYLTGFTKISTSIIFVLPFITVFLKGVPHSSEKSTLERVKGSKFEAIFWIIPLLVDFLLLVLLLKARTTGILVSPWQNLDIKFFLLYAFGTGWLLAFLSRVRYSWLQFILLSCHLFITWDVATLIYTLGFGFDGFIHRAAETWIRGHGVIYPKTPFYIGQYSLVVLFSLVTKIPIFYLDTYLVPIFSSLFFPFVISNQSSRIWDIPRPKALHLVWVIPALYFLSFNLTTPHNLVLILTILTIFTSLGFLKGRGSFALPFILTTAALATHPLLGAPLALFVVTLFLAKRVTSRKVSIFVLFLFVTLIVILPSSMFAANNFLQGFGLPHFTNPITQFSSFIELFKRPFWYQPKAPLLWELLYSWQRLLPLLMIGVGILGFLKEKKKEVSIFLFPAAFLAFLLAAWFLRSSIVFPGVASSEQGNYPTRLIQSSILFLLPWILFGLYEIFIMSQQFIEKNFKKVLIFSKIFFIICISLLISLSLYFSYPQYNPKVHFPGYNITAQDFEAVRWIENNAENDYIVLANILVGATALTEYSFAKHYLTPAGEVFYYSIPSGGPLYNLFSKMVYEGQKREYMEEAMKLTGTREAYFVINSYWAKFDAIVQQAKKTADSWHVIGNDDMYIFRYTRETPSS